MQVADLDEGRLERGPGDPCRAVCEGDPVPDGAHVCRRAGHALLAGRGDAAGDFERELGVA